MSLIKSLIQRLLDSRTTPEEAGHSAMPSPNEVSLTPSVTTKEVWGDVCTGTASSDGYIRMSFSATSPEAIGSARSFGAMVFSTPQLKGDIVSVVCPVAKGKAYAMSARNANNITCAFVKLIGAIGGGYNILVRRALSCLRPSFNYLQRSSCKASILTLLTSVGLVHILRRNTSQAMKEKILWLRSAAGRSLNLVPLLTTLGLGLRTLPGDPATLLTQSATVSGRPSQCKKETRSVSILGPTTQTRLPSYLFATNRLNNLLSTGGALC